MSPDEQSPFDLEPGDMVWMSHQGGKPAQFPAAAVAAWRALGWEPCAAPVDVDPALAERPDLQAATAADPEPVPVDDTEGDNSNEDEE